jgi:flagellar motor protein MotB
MSKTGKLVGFLLLAAVVGVGAGLLRDWLGDARGRGGSGGAPPAAAQAPDQAPDQAPARPPAGEAEAAREVQRLRAELARAREEAAEARGLRQELAAARGEARRLQAELARARKRLAAAEARPEPYAEPIFFGPGQAELDAAGREIAARAARAIRREPGRGVAVEGHADSLPMTAPTKARYGDNLGLSVVRSLNVARELFRQGVPLERVIVVGYGDTRPLRPEKPGRKVNSRRALVRRQMPRP